MHHNFSIFVDFSSIVFKQYREHLWFAEGIQCGFIIEYVCLHLCKFDCYLMHVGSIPKAYILGMVFLILVKIKKTSFPFYFFQLNPKGERQSKENR